MIKYNVHILVDRAGGVHTMCNVNHEMRDDDLVRALSSSCLLLDGLGYETFEAAM